ncbi:uncharacterized protein BJ212DRAFT_1302629 [Suillus subaureus]|uniref:Uncharacterized protein n=1 Tax=Suillus subaureus TaxID=48587 RepID=A0A9P7E2L8_9AGAM|nr:uncharacterized protein BJ212DRAFT_1302629 [Suillus subaureus]KAG1809416.1 hypothetical protein BJ212DRAFT_1302629 [Suillus subaureus]
MSVDPNEYKYIEIHVWKSNINATSSSLILWKDVVQWVWCNYQVQQSQCANNGCSWTGPQHQLSDKHVLSCQYKAIKGFFSINNTQLSSLNTENAALRQKVYTLESVVQTMRRDIQTFKNVLSPWYRLHTQTPQIASPSINAFDQLFLASPSPSPSSRTTINQAQPSSPTDHRELMPHNDINALAPYFPLPHEHTFQESHTYPQSH